MIRKIIVSILSLLPFATLRGQEPYSIKEIYTELRDAALRQSPDALGIRDEEREPYGILVEIGYENAAASIAIFRTGDASMYFTNGGGILGGIGHENIVAAVKNTLKVAESSMKDIPRSDSFGIVKPGSIQILLVCQSGLRAVMVSEKSVFSDHRTRPIFESIQDVISGFREIDSKHSKNRT